MPQIHTFRMLINRNKSIRFYILNCKFSVMQFEMQANKTANIKLKNRTNSQIKPTSIK